MSSVALKFSSLVVRTLSKPIANFIKKQAREHEGFRRTCIAFAQSLHRVDMRLRLGLLQDAAAIDRQVAREAAEASAKKHTHPVQTAKTEAQTVADAKAAAKAKEKGETADSKPASKPRIRPLSEAKAIESGATFISETFLFTVGASLILFESWRSRRKENSRRDDVAERLNDLEESEKAARRALVELEREVLHLRAKDPKAIHQHARILPREIYEVEEKDDTENQEAARSWLSRIANYISNRDDGAGTDLALATNAPGPAETILIQSEAALEAKHKQAMAEAQTAARKPR